MRFCFSLAACDQDHNLSQGPNVGGDGSAQMRLHRMLLEGVRMADCWCMLKQWQVTTRGFFSTFRVSVSEALAIGDGNSTSQVSVPQEERL